MWDHLSHETTFKVPQNKIMKINTQNTWETGGTNKLNLVSSERDVTSSKSTKLTIYIQEYLDQKQSDSNVLNLRNER